MKRDRYIDDFDWDELPIDDTFNVNKKIRNKIRKNKKRVKKKNKSEIKANKNYENE